MRHKFELKLKQRVVIVTDMGRPGVIEKRSSKMYLGGTEAYKVKRESDGASEWYPRFSLIVNEEDSPPPSEIQVCVEEEFPIGVLI